MARMIPSELLADNNSYGEQQVFNALKTLPGEYTVYHSYQWRKRDRNQVRQGEADFIVCHPRNGFLVIEVKSGGIEYSEGRWIQINSATHEQNHMDDPLDQADDSTFFLKRKVIKETIVPGENARVESAVWFSSVESQDVIGKLPQRYDGILFFYRDLTHPLSAIERVYEYYHSASQTNLSDYSYRRILDALCSAFNVVASPKAVRDERESQFVRLTSEQNGLLDYLEEQRVAAIQGAAGTGKTMLAVEKARRLSLRDSVVFLCFNRFLAEHLRNCYQYDNVKFYTMHALASSMLETDKNDWDDIVRLLNNFDRYNWTHKHIIVDEGQDFNDECITALSNIAEYNEGSFYVFYDKHQFVQQKNFPAWLEKAECRLVLNFNCRNTEQISITSAKPVNFSPKLSVRSIKGERPLFYIANDRQGLLKHLEKLINRYREVYAYDQICLLTLKTEEKSLLQGISSIASHKITQERGAQGILFTSARKFKGLESDVIILIDMDEESFSDDEKRRLFYVAASRAKHHLDICFVGSEVELQKLTIDIYDGADTAPKRILTQQLGVRFST